MSSDNNHSSLIGLLGKIAIVMLIAGGGTAWFTLNSLNSSEIVSQVPVTPDSPKTLKPAVAKSSDALQVYWVKITEDKMKLVPQSIDVTKSNNKTNQLRQALQQLLAGQNNEDVTTSIPAGTKLLGCQVDQKRYTFKLFQTVRPKWWEFIFNKSSWTSYLYSNRKRYERESLDQGGRKALRNIGRRRWFNGPATPN